VLVKAHRQALDAGHRLVLVKGGKQVQRILTLTGVAEHLVIVDDPDELLERSP
jgi:anti-anti-sigma regulatory factor